MLQNAILPTAQDLEELLTEATENQSKDDFVAGFISNAANILKERPIMYRAYGMYWWAIKRLLIGAGHSEFGDNLELGTINVFTYDDPALVCCAAWAYHTYNVENGNVYSSSHKVATDGSDEDEDYYLEDLSMESLIQG